MKRSRSLLTAGAYFWMLGLLLMLVIWAAGPTLRSVLLASIILALLVPMGLRAIKGRLDIFEPIVLGNLALGIMFVGRPITDLVTGETIHLGYYVLSTFDEALLVALVGVGFFQLGYFSPVGSAWARRLPAPPVLRPQRAALAGWSYLILGGLLFGAFLASEGGVDLLLVLLQGRQQSDNELFLGSTGYLYGGILMWGATALIFFALAIVAKWRSYWLWFLLPTLFLLVFYGARGTRSQLLPIVIAIPVFWYLWNDRRPRARTLAVAILIGVSLLGWQREVRISGGNRDFIGTLIQALASPLNEAVGILGGSDAEMFDSLANALLIVPEQVPFQHGAIVTDVVIRAVPRTLWPSKPLESNDALVNALWSEHYAISRAAPAFSVIGPFYADSGHATVALGMFLIGAALSMSWRWLQRYRMQPIAQLIYAMGLPFVIILMRGTVPDTLSRMLFLVVPLVLLMMLMRVRFGRSHRPLQAVSGRRETHAPR